MYSLVTCPKILEKVVTILTSLEFKTKFFLKFFYQDVKQLQFWLDLRKLLLIFYC